jgi:DNA-binding GntR family transcriptional regulator
MSKKDLSTTVFYEIRDKILNFEILPGVKVPDKDIAEEMGISRTPVREALFRLAENGLIHAKPNRGFTVRTYTAKEVEDLYNMREALEGLAVKLTIRNINESKIKSFYDLMERYKNLLNTNDVLTFNKLDQEFHDLIAKHSENEFLKQNLRSMHDKVWLIRRYLYFLPGTFQEAYEEHSNIIECVEKRNTNKAKAAMSQHILRAMKDIIRQFNN